MVEHKIGPTPEEEDELRQLDGPQNHKRLTGRRYLVRYALVAAAVLGGCVPEVPLEEKSTPVPISTSIERFSPEPTETREPTKTPEPIIEAFDGEHLPEWFNSEEVQESIEKQKAEIEQYVQGSDMFGTEPGEESGLAWDYYWDEETKQVQLAVQIEPGHGYPDRTEFTFSHTGEPVQMSPEENEFLDFDWERYTFVRKDSETEETKFFLNNKDYTWEEAKISSETIGKTEVVSPLGITYIIDKTSITGPDVYRYGVVFHEDAPENLDVVVGGLLFGPELTDEGRIDPEAAKKLLEENKDEPIDIKVVCNFCAEDLGASCTADSYKAGWQLLEDVDLSKIKFRLYAYDEENVPFSKMVVPVQHNKGGGGFITYEENSDGTKTLVVTLIGRKTYDPRTLDRLYHLRLSSLLGYQEAIRARAMEAEVMSPIEKGPVQDSTRLHKDPSFANLDNQIRREHPIFLSEKID